MPQRTSEWTQAALELAGELKSFKKEGLKQPKIDFMQEKLPASAMRTRLNTMTQQERAALRERIGIPAMMKLIGGMK